MHAYHFTTWETYQTIKVSGLAPAPIDSRHLPALNLMQPYLSDGAIWLYPKRLQGRKLIGMLIYVAINHGSDKIVRIRVEYENCQAASWRALQDLVPEVVAVALRHTYTGVGPCGHTSEPIELLTTLVVPEKIRLVDKWNLLDLTRKLVLA